MLVDSVTTPPGHWDLLGKMGETLRLRRAASPGAAPFLIGTMGTRRAVEVTGNQTQNFANTLAMVKQPICLVDIRRNGVGGSGSWSPAEFATIIPERLEEAGIKQYSFHHLPQAAPSLDLLGAWRRASQQSARLVDKEIDTAVQQVIRGDEPVPTAWRHWQVFKARYSRETAESPAIAAGRAFVEAARDVGGIAIFLCAEERRAQFDSLSPQEQDGCYCHRFTLARQIARSIRRDFPDAKIHRVDLSVGETVTETQLP
jgi:hypothetical protein